MTVGPSAADGRPRPDRGRSRRLRGAPAGMNAAAVMACTGSQRQRSIRACAALQFHGKNVTRGRTTATMEAVTSRNIPGRTMSRTPVGSARQGLRSKARWKSIDSANRTGSSSRPQAVAAAGAAAWCPELRVDSGATVGEDSRPSTRLVLISGWTRGIVWHRTTTGVSWGRELEAPFRACSSTAGDGCASRLASLHRDQPKPRRSRRRRDTPTSPAVRSPTASAPGPRRRARSSTGAEAESLPTRRRVRAVRPQPAAPAGGGYRLYRDYWEFWRGRVPPARRPASPTDCRPGSGWVNA